MRSDAALADRRQSVRDAARDWVRAGWISESVFRNIEKIYPDDRIRTGLAFRVLFFVLTLAAIGGLLGAVYSQIDHAEIVAVIALVAGVGFWAATEYLINTAKRSQGGIEAAFSVAAVGNLMIGVTILLVKSHWIEDRPAVIVLFLFFALLSSASAWAWGYWPYMAFSAASAFIAVMTIPHGRMLWLIASVLAGRWLIAGCDSERLPPSLRTSVAALLTVMIAALYMAANIFLLDHRSLDLFYSSGSFPRWLSIGLTAALPCIVFWLGILRRGRLLLLVGLGLALFSIATLRMYVHVAPPWMLLTGAGVLLMISAAVLRRFLESGRDAERAGFTALPLTGQPDRHRAAEIMATLATMTPEASPPTGKPGFRGDGGGFGGGGASGKF